ncbi:MAG: ATP synthase F1 subunit delta [Leptolyngbyaceae bacterium]|nr:ATP synthase F1 subunit delta [Leptolyngbyaceae bacterium]
MAGSGTLADVVNPYAEGLMGVARANNLTSQISEDVKLLMSLMEESKDFYPFLANPLVDGDAKKGLLRRVVSEQVNPFTLNFLMLLIDRKRISLVKDICKKYQDIYRKLNQVALAEVTSAVPLSDDQQEAVRQKVIQITNAHSVELEARVDPELIGGVVIKVGSQVLDASLKGQLRRIGLSLTR